jgi:hypothetical protein
VKLTTHLHLVPRSKNEWNYTSTPSIRLHGVVLLFVRFNHAELQTGVQLTARASPPRVEMPGLLKCSPTFTDSIPGTPKLRPCFYLITQVFAKRIFLFKSPNALEGLSETRLGLLIQKSAWLMSTSKSLHLAPRTVERIPTKGSTLNTTTVCCYNAV